MKKKNLLNVILLLIAIAFAIGLVWKTFDDNVVARSIFYLSGVCGLIMAIYLYAIKKVPFPKSSKKEMLGATIGAILVAIGAVLKLYNLNDWGNILLALGVGAVAAIFIYSSSKMSNKIVEQIDE